MSYMRPVGHITDAINELTRWKANRERKNVGSTTRRLDVKALDVVIQYLIEFRAMCDILPADDARWGDDMRGYLVVLESKMSQVAVRANRETRQLTPVETPTVIDREIRFTQIACNQRGVDDETLYGLATDGTTWEYRRGGGWFPLSTQKAKGY